MKNQEFKLFRTFTEIHFPTQVLKSYNIHRLIDISYSLKADRAEQKTERMKIDNLLMTEVHIWMEHTCFIRLSVSLELSSFWCWTQN